MLDQKEGVDYKEQQEGMFSGYGTFCNQDLLMIA
jgi:hypothetical protein